MARARGMTRTHRASSVDNAAKTVTYSGYLVINARGDMKISRVVPALEPGEVSVALNLTVPQKLFSRPSIKATVVIPETAGAVDASASVMLDLKNALRQCPGVELQIAGKNGAHS
jgi:hypothetical protein